jgi:hypothetical protein
VSKKARQDTAVQLLTQLTDALNALSEAGITARLKHGAVYTKAGYVLPIGEGRWVARTLLYTELEPTDGQDDDDD